MTETELDAFGRIIRRVGLVSVGPEVGPRKRSYVCVHVDDMDGESYLSPNQARDLADALMAAADEADALDPVKE